MGIFNKKYIAKIAQDDLNDAKLSSAVFEDGNMRKKAFIDVLGARLTMKLLFSKKIEANNLYSLYTIHNILGQLDISDIYYHGIKMDVRVVFDQKEIFIPKSQFQYGILPDVYLVLALNPDFSSAELLGCFEPKNIDKNLQNDNYYFFEQANLIAPDKLKNYLDKLQVETNFIATSENLAKAEELFLPAIDHEISEEEKTFLFQQLANNFELREKFIELENFELVSKQAAKDESLLNDNVLDIIGAQKIFDKDEINDMELETIDISEDEKLSEDEAENINWADIEKLPEVIAEKNQVEDTSSQNNMAETIAEGAIIVGSAAVAGGLLAVGAASAAQSATVASTTAVAEGLASVGSTLGSSFGNSQGNPITEENIAEIEPYKNQDEVEYTDDELDAFQSPEETVDELGFIEDISEPAIEEEIVDEEIELFTPIEETLEEKEIDEIPEIGFIEDEEIDALKATEETDEKLEFIENISEPTIGEEIVDEEIELFTPIEETLEAKEIVENSELEFIEDEEIDSLKTTEETDEKPEFIEDISELNLEEEIADEEIELFTPIEETLEVKEIGENSELEFIEDEEIDSLKTTEETDEKPEFIEDISEPTIEETTSESFAPLEEIPEIDLSSMEVDLKELTPIGELPALEDFKERSEDTETQDNTVDLNNFDFGMFDDEQPSQVELPPHGEGTISFDELTEIGGEGLKFEDETESVESQLEELDDEDIEEKSKFGDMNDISSQVDELLKGVEFSEDQRNLLQNEIGFEPENQNTTEEIPPIVASEIAEDSEIQKETSNNDVNIDLLTATGPLEKDKDLLKVLFENGQLNNGMDENEQLELGDREKVPNNDLQKKKKIIIAASVAGVMLVSIAAGSLVLNNKNKEALPPASTQNSSISPDMQAPSAPGMPGADEQAASPGTDPMAQGPAMLPPQAEQAPQNRDMGKAVSDAFTSEPVNASISKIAWEVPEDLAYNDSFRKYLQIAGKNLKLTLSNDLLLATEMAYSNKMVVDLKIGKDGSIQSSNITTSSGSKQIDGIVLQSVKETLKYLKIPSGEITGQSVNATLIINF